MGRLSNDPVVEVISMRWVPKRTSIPVVLVIVTGIAGFGVWRLHRIFGAVNKTSPSYQSGEIRALNPKHVLYEVFGAPGTVATINYLDGNDQPRQVADTTLPWSYEIITTLPAVFANVVAQRPQRCHRLPHRRRRRDHAGTVADRSQRRNILLCAVRN